MKATLLLALSALLLAACANTRAGISQDADRMSEKAQRITQIIQEP